MKLDLNKPWVLRLVSQSSTANGCSFIRGVLLHTIWNAIIWIAAITGSCIAAVALIGSAYMWFHEPSFFGSEFPNRMTYFGETTSDFILAILVFCGGLIWAAAAILGTFGVVIWLLVNGLIVAHPAMSTVARKAWSAVTPSETFQQAASAWYHKFCPELEFILPAGYEGYKVGARVAKREVHWTPEGDEQVITWPEGTIMKTELKGNRLDLYILWDASVDSLNKHYDHPEIQAEFDSPEELEQERQEAIRLRWSWNDYRLWFGSDEEDLKLVEEISSPV